MVAVVFIGARKPRVKPTLLMLLLSAIFLLLISCGGGGNGSSGATNQQTQLTPAGTYQLTFTATSNTGKTHTLVWNVVVK
jgi:hypothetical protein